MAIITNKNTSQQPNTALGRTGFQSFRFIDAPRVYVKAVESTTAAPVAALTTKSNGTTPNGWTDLGIVSGKAKVTYTKKAQEVRTGIDNVFRAEYINQKDCTIEATLSQVDDLLLEQLSGLAASVLTSGSVVSYAVGQEDIVQMALLLVNQNKLDGKELQFYNPAAYINFTFDADGDALALKMTASLAPFVAAGSTKEQLVDMKFFA